MIRIKQKNYAIDIALIPEKKVFDLAIGINNQLIEKTGDYSIVLGESKNIPHISLAMCGIAAESLDELKFAVFEGLQGYIPYKAEFRGYAVIETSGGDFISGIDIVRDENILEMQDILVNILTDFRYKKINSEFFYEDSAIVSDFSIEYAENYFERQTGKNFSPHITLGHGNVEEIPVYEECPNNFTCNRLAICHLGNHCTCSGTLGMLDIT